MNLTNYMPAPAQWVGQQQVRTDNVPATQVRGARESGNGFEAALNERADRNVNRNENRNTDSPRPFSRTRNEAGNETRSQNARGETDNGLPAENSHAVTDEADRNYPSYGVSAETERPELPEESLPEMAAELLGITTGELAAILADMGADLEEGLYTYQVPKILQAVYKVENPVELLWQPEAVEAAKQIDEAIKLYLAKEDKAVKAPVTEEAKPVEAEAAKAPTEAASPKEANTAKLPAQAEIVSYEYRRAETADLHKQARPEAEAKAPAQEAAKPVSGEADAKQGVTKEELPAGTLAKEQKAAEKPAEEAAPNQQPSVSVQGNQAPNPQAVIVKGPSIPNNAADNVEVVKQLTEQIKTVAQPDTTELRLTLKPESLGEVTMRIASHNGIVTAQLFAETQRIKEIIEQSLNDLKNSLSEKGIQVSEMSAFLTEEEKEHGQGWESKKTVSSSRVSRIMRQNGLKEAEEPQDTAPKNPLEVDYVV